MVFGVGGGVASGLEGGKVFFGGSGSGNGRRGLGSWACGGGGAWGWTGGGGDGDGRSFFGVRWAGPACEGSFWTYGWRI